MLVRFGTALIQQKSFATKDEAIAAYIAAADTLFNAVLEKKAELSIEDLVA